ncbi:carbamoyltransferase HypF [Bacillaceae bacterium S4-13-56]
MDKQILQSVERSYEITIRGRVQGVGFRPFIYQLGKSLDLKGTVQNNMDGVHVRMNSTSEILSRFIDKVQKEAPRLSRVDFCEWKEITSFIADDFTIIPSERSGKSQLVIPVDAAICDDCLEEMRNKSDFRYQYPFINCTQCGPRYTIIRELPYDRPYTSMENFEMCETCYGEYENAENRRHHAQPIACPTCGPHLNYIDIQQDYMMEGDKVILKVTDDIVQGKIVAIKGIGGYHFACDATNEKTIDHLRKRKHRPAKPFAIMARSLEVVLRDFELSSEAMKWMKSPEAPILLLKKKEQSIFPENLAPNLQTVGVMLPYAPLHYLLFDHLPMDYIVMTSANPSGLPLLYQDDEALQYVKEIADTICGHNRPILHPVDDSVMEMNGENPLLIRRARGFVPDPISSRIPVNGIIALGSQQKNTFALGRQDQIFVGPHIGDLGDERVESHFHKELDHLMKWMDIHPSHIVIDKHPSFSTRGMTKLWEAPVIEVQHHHAHFAACMEENHLEKPAFGLILDGTGYGEDGQIWGFECFYGTQTEVRRMGHLDYFPLPGGEKSVKEPWRTTAGLFLHYLGAESMEELNKTFPTRVSSFPLINKMIQSSIHSPLAGTCGRLFDAISAWLGIGEVSTYDGEAAIKLSEVVRPFSQKGKLQEPYSVDYKNVNGLLKIQVRKMLSEMMDDRNKGKSILDIALRFHETIISQCVQMIMHASKQDPTCKDIVLSGGSFHNEYLRTRVREELKEKGFEVYEHKQLPPNDGGLSYGQMVVASYQLIEGRV